MSASYDVIGSYARLTLYRERLQAAGRPVPPNVTAQIQAIESRAQSVLSPAQLQATLQHVEVAKHRLIQNEARQARAQSEREQQRVADKTFKGITQGGFFDTKGGLTYDQLQAVRQGKYISNRPVQKRTSQDEIDSTFRERTKGMDPAGRGWSQKEWEQRLDELADAGNQQEFDRLVKRFRANPADLRVAADRWREERYGYEVNKRLAARDKDDEQPVVTDSDVRRAEIIHNTFQSTATSPKGEKVLGQLMDQVSDDYLEDDGRRGDVARAFVEVEEQQETENGHGA